MPPNSFTAVAKAADLGRLEFIRIGLPIQIMAVRASREDGKAFSKAHLAFIWSSAPFHAAKGMSAFLEKRDPTFQGK